MTIKDTGIRREEHKVLYEFLPGQLTSHTPRWAGKGKPPTFSLKTRITRIKNIGKSNENSIRLETEPKIRSSIEALARIKSGTELEIEYYEVSAEQDKPIIVELELFPDVWEVDLGNKEGRRLFSSSRLPEGVKIIEEPRQTNAVFCNALFPDFPFIEGVHVPDKKCWITKQTEPSAKKIVYENGNIEPIHARRELPTDDRDWKLKARFPNDRSNFVPYTISDVYSPTLKKATEKTILCFWESLGIIEVPFDNKVKQAAEILAKNGITMIEVVCENIISKYLKEKEYLDELKDKTGLLLGGKLSDEDFKISVMKTESQSQWSNNLFDVYYCDNFQIGNFAVGYFSGRYYNLSEKPAPILRSFPGVFFEATSTFSIYGSNSEEVRWFNKYQNKQKWPVFFQLFDTEGLLFVANKNIKDKLNSEDEVQEVVHTISHALTKNIPKYSGIDHGLVREFLFSDQPAFFLYSREPGRFRSKGFRFLFEHKLSDLFYEAAETLDCPFQFSDMDIDKHEKGCGNCTMLPIGCTEFNQNLNRSLAVKVLENL